MDVYADKVENYLSGVSGNPDQSVYESTTISVGDQSHLSKNNVPTITHSDPFILTLREWINSHTQLSEDEETYTKDTKTDYADKGLNLIETTASALETITLRKEELRHRSVGPHCENVLPLHFDKHESFLNMVNCLRDIGSKYEAFSILTPENVMSSITQHTECLDEVRKKLTEFQQLSLATAADTEEIRKKKL